MYLHSDDKDDGTAMDFPHGTSIPFFSKATIFRPRQYYTSPQLNEVHAMPWENANQSPF